MSNILKLVAVGEVKTAKDGRQYYKAEFGNPNNPFSGTRTRMFWQQFATVNGVKTPVWRGADPEVTKTFVGKTLTGKIVSADVEPFEIAIAGQEPRTVTTYTTVVLDGESTASVFKACGHQLAVAQPVAEEIA